MNCFYFVGIGFNGLKSYCQEIYQFEFLTECNINQLKAQGFLQRYQQMIYFIFLYT